MPDGHLITLSDLGGREGNDDNDYKIVFTGGTKPEYVTADGATIDKSDRIGKNKHGEYYVRGRVNGGEDAIRYYGGRKRAVAQYPGQLFVSVNSRPPEDSRRYGFQTWKNVPGERRVTPPTKKKPSDTKRQPTKSPDEPTDIDNEDAKSHGIDIRRTKTVSSAGELRMKPHTRYVVTRPILANRRIGRDRTNDVEIVATESGSIVVPAHDVGYDILCKRAENVRVACPIDQRATGARGRIALPGDNNHLDGVRFLGDAIEPGYNPDGGRSARDQTGPTLYMPALGKGAKNHTKDVRLKHEGTCQSKHWGVGPIFAWAGPEHRGTWVFEDVEVIDNPSDGIYITNCTGSVIARRVTTRNNHTAGIRFANGKIIDCDVSYDYKHTTMKNAENSGNANVGIMIEAKQDESSVTIEGGRVHLANVGKSRGAINARHLTDPGIIERIDDVEIIVDNAPYHRGDHAPGLMVDRSSACRVVKQCVFRGDAKTGTHIRNLSDTPVKSRENMFSNKRKNANRNVNWGG